MSPSGPSLRLYHLTILVVVVLVTLVGADSAWAESRLWTDSTGQTMTADFIRVTGSDVIFKRGTRVIRIPLEKLSEADQKFINGTQGGNGARFWTVNGRKLRGTFKSYSEGEATIHVGRNDRKLSVSVLSKEDRDHIRQRLDDDGKFGDLPDTDPLKASGESFRRSERPSVRNVPGSQADGDPVADAKPFVPEARTWTDTKGRKVDATFVRMDDGKVVLRRTKDGKEMAIPMLKLDFPDRAAAIKTQSRARLAAAGGNSGDGSESDAGFARRHRPSPPQNPFANVPSGDDAIADARERSREQRERMSREAEESRLAAEQRHNEQVERMQLDAEERRREREERFASTDSPFPRADSHSLPSAHRPNSDYQSSSSYSETMIEQYICTVCEKEVPSHIGAGDHCPHCNAFFEYEEGANGERDYAPISKRINVRGVRGIGKLVVFVLIVLGGLISRLFGRR